MFGVGFVDLFPSLIFLEYVSPFNICCKAGLMVLNSLNFCLSEKLLISPPILNKILAGTIIMTVDFSLSVLEIYPAISFWPPEFLLKNQLLSVWGFPCMLLVASLLLLLIFFLCV